MHLYIFDHQDTTIIQMLQNYVAATLVPEDGSEYSTERVSMHGGLVPLVMAPQMTQPHYKMQLIIANPLALDCMYRKVPISFRQQTHQHSV